MQPWQEVAFRRKPLALAHSHLALELNQFSVKQLASFAKQWTQSARRLHSSHPFSAVPEWLHLLEEGKEKGRGKKGKKKKGKGKGKEKGKEE